MILVPAILAFSQKEFVAQWEKVSLLSKRIQIDITEGKIQEALSNLATVNTQNHVLDFHCMVENWEQAYTLLQRIPHNLILFNQRIYKPDIGLVISPNDTVDRQDYSLFRAIQIMTVIPGEQGRPFLPQKLSLLNDLRSSGFTGELLIDGGVNDNTIQTIMKNDVKPDVLCIGSYFTHAKNPQKNYETINHSSCL